MSTSHVPVSPPVTTVRAPRLVRATANETGKVVLSWEAVSGATGYSVWRSVGTNPGGATQIATVVGTSHDDAGAGVETPYFYWVKTQTAAGDSDFSGMATGWREVGAPGVPTALTASDDDSNQVSLAWTAAGSAEAYRVYRATVDNSATAEYLGTTPGTSFDDTTAVHGTTYYYWVAALNYTHGKGAYSDGASGVRIPPVPAAPAGVSASDGLHVCKVEVSWTGSEFATEYRVYRDGVYLGTTAELLWEDAISSFSSHVYSVRAANSTGESADASDYGYAAAPAAPTGVAASDDRYDAVRVEWNASTGATEYSVYRDGVLLEGGVTDLFYDDATAVAGVGYLYQVKAVVGVIEESGLSTGDYGTKLVLPAPDNVAASDTDYDKVAITWDAVTGADSYELYRDGVVCETGLTEPSFDDTSVTIGQVYSYQVKTVKGAVVSALSTADNGVRPQLPAPVITATRDEVGQISVTWDYIPGATGGYEVYREGGLVAVYYAETDSLHVETGGADCVPYTFVVRALRAGNNSDYSNEYDGWRVPDPEFCISGGLTLESQSAAYDQTFNACGGVTLDVYFNRGTGPHPDRLRIYVDGYGVYDSGCGLNEATTQVILAAGASHTVRFLVDYDCDDNGGQGIWTLVVDCLYA